MCQSHPVLYKVFPTVLQTCVHPNAHRQGNRSGKDFRKQILQSETRRPSTVQMGALHYCGSEMKMRVEECKVPIRSGCFHTRLMAEAILILGKFLFGTAMLSDQFVAAEMLTFAGY